MRYYPQVIREARFHIGMDAPAHEFMGQIATESRCDAGITAFDGGMGLGQFMPATADWIQEREQSLREVSAKPQPYDPKWAIRAMILYDKWLYDNTDCKGWYYAYRSYNGGLGNMNKEIRAAGSCDRADVEKACKRRILKLKSGLLDLCNVNISYPQKIVKAGEKYRVLIGDALWN